MIIPGSVNINRIYSLPNVMWVCAKLFTRRKNIDKIYRQSLFFSKSYVFIFLTGWNFNFEVIYILRNLRKEL